MLCYRADLGKCPPDGSVKFNLIKSIMVHKNDFFMVCYGMWKWHLTGVMINGDQCSEHNNRDLFPTQKKNYLNWRTSLKLMSWQPVSTVIWCLRCCIRLRMSTWADLVYVCDSGLTKYILVPRQEFYRFFICFWGELKSSRLVFWESLLCSS